MSEPFAAETLTISSTAASLSPASYGGENVLRATITVETADVRWWASGNTPTTTEGHLVSDGESFCLNNRAAVVNFKAIRAGGTDGVLQVTYER